MSYGRRWLSRTTADTREYWTLAKSTTTVAGPIIVGILWVIFKPWGGWRPIMQVAFVSVIGFCALWGLVFFFSLLLVPGKLDAERAKEIHERIAANEELGRQIGILQQEIKKDPVQEHLESQARNALDKMQPHQREFIRWLLDQPEIAETETMNMCPAGLHPHAIREGITEGKKHGLVAVRLGTSPLSPGGERFASINPRFVDALTHIFHIQPVTPTQV